MALQDKQKELLKQFLTYNLAQDFDDLEKREKFVEIFRNMVMSDDPEMKDIVLSMFDSFNKYQSTIDNPVDDKEESSDETNNDTSEDGGNEPPSQEKIDAQFESYSSNKKIDRINELLGW